MYSSGLRSSELINLEAAQLNLDDRILFVKQGKGKKDRYVPFSTAALKFLLLYINKKRNTRNDYLFPGLNGKMNYGKLRLRFKKYLNSFGLSKKGYTMHSVRHATATHLLSHGADIRYVQELLGHEDLKTTQLYTRPEEDNIKAVYRTYHPRENEYYRELENNYINEAFALKDRLLWGEKRSAQYQQTGNVHNCNRYKKKEEKHHNFVEDYP